MYQIQIRKYNYSFDTLKNGTIFMIIESIQSSQVRITFDSLTNFNIVTWKIIKLPLIFKH